MTPYPLARILAEISANLFCMIKSSIPALVKRAEQSKERQGISLPTSVEKKSPVSIRLWFLAFPRKSGLPISTYLDAKQLWTLFLMGDTVRTGTCRIRGPVS